MSKKISDLKAPTAGEVCRALEKEGWEFLFKVVYKLPDSLNFSNKQLFILIYIHILSFGFGHGLASMKAFAKPAGVMARLVCRSNFP